MFTMKVLITGSTKGIGWAIAEKLAENGCHIFLHGRNADDLKKNKATLEKKHPNCDVFTAASDLSTKDGVKQLVAAVQKHWSVLDVLINNAGVFLPGNITEEADGTLESQINTNLYSAYHLTRMMMSSIHKSKQAHIFNMCSIASKIAYPNGGSYSISKFALLGFNKVLREELKPKGIKVTAILPGATWSNSWAGVDLPHERLMEANDIAIAVWSAIQMSPAAVVEEIVLRPQLGDL